MKQTITISGFRNAFVRMNRADRFTYDGLVTLFDYLNEVDPDMELDVIALCCDYGEYNREGLEFDFGHVPDNEVPESIEEWAALLQNHTTVLTVDESRLIVQAF